MAINLSLKLQPKQSELNELCENSYHRILGYGGSRGGGKSGALRRIMLLRRLKYPGTAGIIFRRVYDDLKRNHIDKFFDEFRDLFQFYRASDHEVIIPSSDGKPPSRIVFAYAETEAEIKRKFHGPEYMDMFIDQAEQLSEQELKLMMTANRWPGTPRGQCKFVLFFNPGGVGLPYFKRIFKDKEYHGKEKEEDYAFIQAYGWDNVEWVRSALVEEGLDEDVFYSWDNNTRFEYFLTNSEYGQVLDSLPQAMRIGHLLGSFDAFAGQYFDIWNSDTQVWTPQQLSIKAWHPKWVSIDWGFSHDAAILWWAQDGQTTKTYREHVEAGMGPRVLAQHIIDKSHREDGEPEEIDAVYLSPDAFAKRTNEDTIAQQIGQVLRAAGFPNPRPADDDRKSGWMLMYEMLRYGQWVISDQCPRLIANIPLFSRDDKDPEDCTKFLGDDPGDSARYGLKSRFGAREVPKELQLESHMEALKSRMAGRGGGEIHTAMHLSSLKFQQEWKKKHLPVRRIRPWRGR